jgi:hypothetical protein
MKAGEWGAVLVNEALAGGAGEVGKHCELHGEGRGTWLMGTADCIS